MSKKTRRSPRLGSPLTPPSTAASVTPISDKLDQIVLSDTEANLLRALDQNVAGAKMRLADLQIQLLASEQQRLALAQKVLEGQGQLQELVRSTAKANGIDIDDMTKRWDLNLAKGVITRVS